MKNKKKKKEKNVEVLTPGSLAIESEASAARPLALPSMFWIPEYVEDAAPAWLGHLPFAFWIVEAMRPAVLVELGSHFGNSYFAFCQAVERLQIGTRCYAIDTWKGDEHAGFYGEEVWAQVSAHNNSRYAAFSTLVRSSFDEALLHFEDGNVDLLHIDGHHTFEAVRHDFETWLPKLSNRGLVLLHDTNVRFGSFGVSKFFSFLKQTYPAFEFHHSHGLGVVGIGADQTSYLRQLFSSSSMPTTSASLHRIFARLGRSCDDLALARSAHKQAASLERQLSAKTSDYCSLEQELNRAFSKLQEMENISDNAPREIAALNEKIAQLESDQASSANELAQLSAERDAIAKTFSSLEIEHAALHGRLVELEAERDTHQGKRVDLEARYRSLEAEQAVLKTRCQQQTLEVEAASKSREAFRQSLDERFRELAVLAQKLVDLEQKTSALAKREDRSAEQRGELVVKVSTRHKSEDQAARQRGLLADKITAQHRSSLAREKQLGRRMVRAVLGAIAPTPNRIISVGTKKSSHST